MDKGEEIEQTTTTGAMTKKETSTTKALPTPSPSPVRFSEPAAASNPARRAVRTYGKRRPLLNDASRGNILAQPTQPRKRQKTNPAAGAETRQAATVVSDSPKVDAAQPPSQLREAEEVEQRKKEGPEIPRTPSPHKQKAQTQKAGSDSRKKGIMRYFQLAGSRCAAVAPSLSPPRSSCSPAGSSSSISSLSSSLGLHDLGESEDDNAFSSPLWGTTERRPRPKRRLIIRPDVDSSTPTASTALTMGAGQGLAGEEPIRAENAGKNGDSALMTTRASMPTTTSSQMHGESRLSNPSSMAVPATKKRKKTSGTPPVQTTLSLAIAGGDCASVKECKECNILYNPLHEKDAKFHARYHASVCRMQQS
ncbi:hypothetical protein SEPCBS119000_003363 [Sporothrix epigloea]|uniref:N-acetyltransferase ESCO zinc-finger domain-containing protein n=1 Tax=Sporothrix epigloea TaxID=1892477 RepID=A0ABP0DPR8_9PEZI